MQMNMVFVLVTIVNVLKLKKNKFMKHGGYCYELRTRLQVNRIADNSFNDYDFIYETRIFII